MSEENTLPPGIEMKSEATYPGVLSKVGHTIADTVVTGVAGGIVGAGVGALTGVAVNSVVPTSVIETIKDAATHYGHPVTDATIKAVAPTLGAAIVGTVGATGGAMAGFGTGAVSSFTSTTEKPVVGKWTQQVIAQPSGVREL